MESLEQVLRSPHLQSAARALGDALADPEERHSLLFSFGLRAEDALSGGSDPLAMLVAALNAKANRERGMQEEGEGAEGGGADKSSGEK